GAVAVLDGKRDQQECHEGEEEDADPIDPVEHQVRPGGDGGRPLREPEGSCRVGQNRIPHNCVSRFPRTVTKAFLWHSRPRLCSGVAGNRTFYFELRSNTAEGGCATFVPYSSKARCFASLRNM